MADVNDWTWQSDAAEVLGHKGAVAVAKGLMQRVLGDYDPSVLAVTFQEAAQSLLGALEIEQPAVPLPYAHLAVAYSQLVVCLYSEAGSSESDDLYEKAKVCSDEALRFYSRSTGWGSGWRHDFHVSMAMAHFFQEDFTAARAHLEQAAAYLCEEALLERFAGSLREKIGAIEAL